MARRPATGSPPPPRVTAGNTYQNVSANISGLSASTTYHFRIVATNSAGTSYGSDRTFTTLSATGPPVVTTNPATNVTSSSATLNGSLDPHGLTTNVYFQYGTTTSYGHTTPMQSQTGNTYRNVSCQHQRLKYAHHLSFPNCSHQQRRHQVRQRQNLYHAVAPNCFRFRRRPRGTDTGVLILSRERTAVKKRSMNTFTVTIQFQRTFNLPPPIVGFELPLLTPEGPRKARESFRLNRTAAATAGISYSSTTQRDDRRAAVADLGNQKRFWRDPWARTAIQ